MEKILDFVLTKEFVTGAIIGAGIGIGTVAIIENTKKKKKDSQKEEEGKVDFPDEGKI